MSSAPRFIALLISLLLASVPLKAEEHSGTARVGVVLSLSGSVALIGQGLQRAVLMADEEFDKDHQVDFIFEDDQYLPKYTVTAVQKLIASDHVDGLFVFGSPGSYAVADFAERGEIPLVSISTATGVSSGRKFIVRHWVNADDEARVMVQEGERRKYQSVVVLTTQSDGYLAVQKDYLQMASCKVLRSEEVDPQDRDFKTEALKIRALNPSAVVLLLAPPQSGIVAKQLRALGYKGEFVSIHTFELDPEVIALSPAVLGAWYVLGDERPASVFLEQYRTKYGVDAVAGTVNGYDIAKLFIEGLRTGNLNRYLHEVKDFQGQLGVYSANDHGGFTLPVAIKEVSPTGLKYISSPR